MKKVLIAALLITSMASCDVYYVEPVYDSRDAITGYYQVEDYSNTFEEYHHYSIYISKGSRSSGMVHIEDLYVDGLEVYAYLDGSYLTIPYQVVNGYEVEGDGTIDAYDISLDYRVKDRRGNNINDFCDLYGDR